MRGLGFALKNICSHVTMPHRSRNEIFADIRFTVKEAKSISFKVIIQLILEVYWGTTN